MSDQTAKPSLQQQIVMDEIAGKNKAIQTYDQTLWTIRSGYLTLTFAGWGALLTLGGNQANLLVPVGVAMLFVTLGLAFAGFQIDKNYVTRKYRCIYALGILLNNAFENMNQPEKITQRAIWLRVSGDDSEIDPKRTDVGVSFRHALKVTRLIYSITPASIVFGGFVSYHLLSALNPETTC